MTKEENEARLEKLRAIVRALPEKPDCYIPVQAAEIVQWLRFGENEAYLFSTYMLMVFVYEHNILRRLGTANQQVYVAEYAVESTETALRLKNLKFRWFS